MDALRWRQAFLQRRGLNSSDRRPLCAYRSTSDEFLELRTLLKGRLDGPPDAQQTVLESLFVLYAAEWWRRLFVGGPWRWNGILTDVALQLIPVPELFGVVQRGLSLWGRPLRSAGISRAFLGTLACEGGLPLQVIRNSNAPLTLFFRTLLQDIQLYSSASHTPAQLAAEHAHFLPQSFRHDYVYELAGQLATVVWELQKNLQGQAGDPIRILDEHDPTWRDRLPMSIDDNIALKFLRGLVDAAVDLAKAPVVTLRVRRELRQDDEDWHLCANLELPRSISEYDLAQLLQCQPDQLSVRLEMGIISESNRLAPIAWLSRQSVDETYLAERLHHHHVMFSHAETIGAIDLVVRTGQDNLRGGIPDGGQGLGELPWVFLRLRNNDNITFAAEGSVSTRHSEAWVALTSAMALQPCEGAEIKETGSIKACNRTLYRLKGEALISDADGGLTRIRTRSSSEETHAYRLVGTTRRIGITDQTVHHGWPGLLKVGSPALVAQNQLEWHPRGVGRRSWKLWSDRVFGAGHLRYKQNGEVRFRCSVSVVPEGLAVSIGRQMSSHGGQLILTGLQDAEVIVQQRDTFQRCMVTRPDHDTAHIDVEVDRSAAPAAISVLLHWRGGGELICQLPFPARRGQFIGPHGTPLNDGTLITLEQLHGVTARVITPSGFHAYPLVGELQAWGLDATISRSVWLRHLLAPNPNNRQVHELELRLLHPELETMLSASSKLHAQVELRFDTLPGQPRLCVARYDLGLESTTHYISLDTQSFQRLQPETLEKLEVNLVPIFAPESPYITLEHEYRDGVPTGRWMLPNDQLEPGPWMAVGRERNWQRMRPLLCTIKGDEAPPSGSNDLLTAIRIKDTEQRLHTMRTVIVKMEGDPSDPNWEHLIQVFKLMNDVDPAAVDVFRALVNQPRAAVMALFKSEPSAIPDWINLFEKMPFSWFVIPIQAWEQGIRRIVDHYKQLFAEIDDPDIVISAALGGVLNRLPTEPFRWEVIRNVCIREWHGDYPPDSPVRFAKSPKGKSILQQQLLEAKQELLVLNANTQWPEGRSVTGWLEKRLNDNPQWRSLCIPTQPGTSFRTAVLNAPIAAALISANELPFKPPLLLELRSLYGFDKQWFEEAYSKTLIQLL